jgi:hypothetical protein
MNKHILRARILFVTGLVYAALAIIFLLLRLFVGS